MQAETNDGIDVGSGVEYSLLRDVEPEIATKSNNTSFATNLEAANGNGDDNDDESPVNDEDPLQGEVAAAGSSNVDSTGTSDQVDPFYTEFYDSLYKRASDESANVRNPIPKYADMHERGCCERYMDTSILACKVPTAEPRPKPELLTVHMRIARSVGQNFHKQIVLTTTNNTARYIWIVSVMLVSLVLLALSAFLVANLISVLAVHIFQLVLLVIIFWLAVLDLTVNLIYLYRNHTQQQHTSKVHGCLDMLRIVTSEILLYTLVITNLFCVYSTDYIHDNTTIIVIWVQFALSALAFIVYVYGARIALFIAVIYRTSKLLTVPSPLQTGAGRQNIRNSTKKLQLMVLAHFLMQSLLQMLYLGLIGLNLFRGKRTGDIIFLATYGFLFTISSIWSFVFIMYLSSRSALQWICLLYSQSHRLPLCFSQHQKPKKRGI